MSFSKDTIDFRALLYALSRQSTSLPFDLQQQLTEIGRSLQANPNSDRAIELDRLIASYEPLEREYQQSIADSQQQYTSQERAKSLGASWQIDTRVDDLFIGDILLSKDSVRAAKNLIYRHDRPRSSSFLKRGDRVVALASGGAFLGVLIAQIPGAVVGALIAGIYAWFSFPTAKTDGSN